MTVSEITKKMINYSMGDRHDITCPLCREECGNTSVDILKSMYLASW